ncbi:MAG: hemolysin III family protein [Burkholderiales bacterium]|jgi:hemolysin III|nr:hemolysin III family protein [Burkholderiales bacterium]
MYYGERFNAISHCVGAALALSGSTLLIVFASLYGSIWHIVSTSIYGASLTALYTISTFYHSLRGRFKQVFQRLDHCAIYLLIAGTYTPFTLVTLHGAWGWTLFGINWGLAAFGIAQEFWLGHRTRILSLPIYVVMGWLIVIAVKPLMTALPTAGLIWLAAGGLLYTSGIIFYIFDEKIRHGHGIWHLFVLAGSVCQFIAVLFYVVF